MTRGNSGGIMRGNPHLPARAGRGNYIQMHTDPYA